MAAGGVKDTRFSFTPLAPGRFSKSDALKLTPAAGALYRTTRGWTAVPPAEVKVMVPAYRGAPWMLLAT